MRALRAMFAVALSLFVGAAAAGRHQICYEDEAITGNMTAVWGCYEDAGGRCKVQPLTGPTVTSINAFNHPAQGDYVKEMFQSWATYSIDIQFFNAGNSTATPDETRSCEVNGQAFTRGAASANAELTGFTTDRSGLVTTGVWKVTSAVQSRSVGQTVNVPWDFAVVGGGVIGQELPSGALIVESEVDSGNPRGWSGKTSDDTVVQSHTNTVYAIGMRIHGVDFATLQSWIQHPSGSSPLTPAHFPVNEIQRSQGSVLLSGGTFAKADSSNSTTLLGQYATNTYPVLGAPMFQCTLGTSGLICEQVTLATAWHVSSSDHLANHPGFDDVSATTIPSVLNINGSNWAVVAAVVSSTSDWADHPTADVSGLLGDFALTGIGARVELAPFVAVAAHLRPPPRLSAGNLLWKLEPRPDIGGATVASKDHIRTSPARITAYAIGVKLVQVDPRIIDKINFGAPPKAP